MLAGTTKENIDSVIQKQLRRKTPRETPEKWDGQSARRIVEVLVGACSDRASRELAIRPAIA